MSHFTNVGLIGRKDSETTKYSLGRLISYLEKQGVKLYLDEETSEELPESKLDIKSRSELAKLCDLIIVVESRF